MNANAGEIKPTIYLSGKSTIDENGELKYSGSVTRMKAKLEELGAEIVMVDHRTDKPSQLRNADAVVFMGNDGDIDPKQYGAEKNPKTKSELDIDTYKGDVENFKIGVARSNYENEAMELNLQNNTPIFGVCGGLQRLNVIKGGTLKQHVDGQMQNFDDPATVDIDESDVTVPIEKIRVAADSLLAGILRPQETMLTPKAMNEAGEAPTSTEIMANSYHHQVIDKLGEGLKASAISEHGTIEAIESTNPEQYIMSVQWHPEFLQDNPVTNKLLGDFVDKAAENAAKRAQEKAEQKDVEHEQSSIEPTNMINFVMVENSSDRSIA